MRLFSWNVNGVRAIEKKGFLDWVDNTSPDILCIQEGLNYQVEYLNSKMNNHKYLGVGRDDAKENGEYCAIFFNEKKYKLLKTSNKTGSGCFCFISFSFFL